MARIGRPPGSGSGTHTAPGTCETCGRAKVWKADSRRAAGGYWTCSHGVIGEPRPRKPRLTGARIKRRRPGKAEVVGSSEWMRNPAIAACAADWCFFDKATCPIHRRKT